MISVIRPLTIIWIAASLPISAVAQQRATGDGLSAQPRNSDKSTSGSTNQEVKAKRESDGITAEDLSIGQLKAELETLRAEMEAKDAKLERLSIEHGERLNELDSALMSALVASSSATESRVRVVGFMVVSHSCSALISPRPL